MSLVDCHAHLEELDDPEAAIRETPLQSILLETDSPVTYGGRTSEPADVVSALRAVARIKKASETDVARVTTENATEFFGLCPERRTILRPESCRDSDRKLM